MDDTQLYVNAVLLEDSFEQYRDFILETSGTIPYFGGKPHFNKGGRIVFALLLAATCFAGVH